MIRVSPTEHPDLWAGIPGSYGSLALVVAVKLNLTQRGNSLIVRHRRMPLDEFLTDTALFNHEFLDAICDHGDEVVVTTADTLSSEHHEYPRHRPRWWSPYYCDHVMATSGERDPERWAFQDYAFRYDRGAFWIAPTKLGRSFISRFVFGGFASAQNLYRLRRKKQAITNAPSTRIVQDCITPLETAAELITFVRSKISGPLWLLPITAGMPNLLGLGPGRWLNVGIYLEPDLPDADVQAINTNLERELNRLGGRKTLHADLFYTPELFAAVYDIFEYERLRQEYQAEGAFRHLYDKLGIEGEP